MQIYLPIAGMPVDIIVILVLGAITGILSGMFGVGGGFLMTPFLIFVGVPPAVAVSSSANQIIGASFSGFLAHWRRKNVDFLMGTFLTIGGLFGSSIGVWLFTYLQTLGQIDLIIALSYVLFLGGIGALMLVESIRTIRRKKANISTPSSDQAPWLHRIALPWVVYFPHSQLKISAILPLAVGFFIGILVSLMGVGGGFILIPAMIYILGMPTSVVIGTSLFQIIFITCNVTLLQAMNTQTVDIVLAFLMLISSVIGSQVGTRMGLRMQPEYLRAFLASLVILVVCRLAYGLFIEPSSLYEITVLKAS